VRDGTAEARDFSSGDAETRDIEERGATGIYIFRSRLSQHFEVCL
jgi:hypothetical protein